MSEYVLVETIYGKYNKFEIKREIGGLFSRDKFWIYKDGEYYTGSYDSLPEAVDAVNRLS